MSEVLYDVLNDGSLLKSHGTLLGAALSWEQDSEHRQVWVTRPGVHGWERLRQLSTETNTLGWNTFPVPTLTEQNKADLTRCAEDIRLAREAHFPATIADLYKPETEEWKMPANLRAAHEANDETLERFYIGRRFKNDTERLETQFERYAKMTEREPVRKPARKRPVGVAQ